MSAQTGLRLGLGRQAPRPPRAVVGSQINTEEQIFGAFDGRIIRRFWTFISPYRRQLVLAVIAVLVFAATQISIPLIVRSVIDRSLLGAGRDAWLLTQGALAFLAIVSLNFVANLVQETLVARIAERLLVNLRRAMYAHLQRVSLSFMDKTEVGRLMSRLQGDVNALQEFLETSVFAIGDFVLLLGIAVVLLVLDWRLGLLTLSVVPILVGVRIVWLPRARRAFLRARITSSTLNGALAEGIHGVRTVQGMGREAVNLQLFEEKVADNLDAQLRGTWLAQIMVPIVDTLTGAAMGIVVVIGGIAVQGGRLDLGVMVAFLFYVQRFFDPIRSLTMQYSVMQRAMASGQRIFEVLDVPIDVAGPAGGARPREHRWRGRVRERDLRLRPGHPGAARRELQGRARRDGGAGGAHRLRQDQHHGAGPPLLRRLERPGPGRRPRRARSRPGRARPPHRDGAAGAVPVHRHGPGEHPLRHPRGQPRAGDRGGARGRRPRLHHAPGARLRDPARAARRQSFPGPAPADQLCPGAGRGVRRSWCSTRPRPPSTATPSA